MLGPEKILARGIPVKIPNAKKLMPVVQALWRLRQEDRHKYEATLGYLAHREKKRRQRELTKYSEVANVKGDWKFDVFSDIEGQYIYALGWPENVGEGHQANISE